MELPQDKLLLESALLVVRWQRGDRGAFEGIVKRWERSLFYYLRRLAPNEADAWECLQETWLKALKSLKSLRDPQTLPAYLYRIARNVAIGRLRRPELLDGQLDTTQVPDDRQPDPLEGIENAELVHSALDRLPILQREVLTLFFLHELSVEQMSVLLGVPVGTVKSRLFYAREAIRQLLQGDNHVTR